MSSDSTRKRGVDLPQAADSVNLGTWIAVIFLSHAVGFAIFTGFVGLVMNIPARKLLVPYLMLAYCGFIFAPLLYWVRLSRNRPKTFAARSAVITFVYLQIVMLALGLGAIRLGILSAADAINGYGPFMLPFSAIVSVMVYFVMRQMHADVRSG